MNVSSLCSVTRGTRTLCDNDSATGEKEEGRWLMFCHLRSSSSSSSMLFPAKKMNLLSVFPSNPFSHKHAAFIRGGLITASARPARTRNVTQPSSCPRRHSFYLFSDLESITTVKQKFLNNLCVFELVLTLCESTASVIATG